MPQITGKAIIKVDGNQWRTTDGCKLHPGGVEREAKVGGGKVQGYSEKSKARSWTPRSITPRTQT